MSDDHLVELIGRNPAPLRGWIAVSDEASDEGLNLDDFGCSVLGVSDGDQVALRKLSMPELPRGLAHPGAEDE